MLLVHDRTMVWRVRPGRAKGDDVPRANCGRIGDANEASPAEVREIFVDDVGEPGGAAGQPSRAEVGLLDIPRAVDADAVLEHHRANAPLEGLAGGTPSGR